MFGQQEPLYFESDYAAVYQAVDVFLRHIERHRLPFRRHGRISPGLSPKGSHMGYIVPVVQKLDVGTHTISHHGHRQLSFTAHPMHKRAPYLAGKAYCLLEAREENKSAEESSIFIVPSAGSDPRSWYELSDTEKNGPNFCQHLIGKLHEMKRQPLYFKAPVRMARKTVRNLIRPLVSPTL